MRNTKQRSLVLETVCQSYTHPTAFEVYQECVKVIPNISLGTVYRNLNSLVSLGSIKQLEIPGHVARYDDNFSHDHFVCMKCGKVIDLVRDKSFYQNEIDGNVIIDCSVRYDGICCDCVKIKEESEVYGTKGK